MKKFLLVSMLSFSMLLTACGGGGAEQAADGDVIKLGFIGPLTGNAAAYGQDMKAGVELYFRENPEIDGKKVEVIFEDGRCNPQDAASAAQKLVSVDGVKYIIGGMCSGETLGAAPVAEANQVLLMSPGSSSPEITTAGDYVFRAYPSDAKVGESLAEALLAQYKSIAMITETTDYAEAYRGSVKGLLKQNDVAPVLDETFVPDSTDFKTMLQKVKDAEADVLVMIAQTPVTAGFIVKQAAELDLGLPIYGTDTAESKQLLDIAKNAAEGLRANVVVEDPKSDRVKWFVGEIPEIQSSNILAIKSYDAAELAARAIDEVGLDATAIKDYYYGMAQFEGIGGPVKFDANGDNNSQGGAIKIVRDGVYVLE